MPLQEAENKTKLNICATLENRFERLRLILMQQDLFLSITTSIISQSAFPRSEKTIQVSSAFARAEAETAGPCRTGVKRQVKTPQCDQTSLCDDQGRDAVMSTHRLTSAPLHIPNFPFLTRWDRLPILYFRSDLCVLPLCPLMDSSAPDLFPSHR